MDLASAPPVQGDVFAHGVVAQSARVDHNRYTYRPMSGISVTSMPRRRMACAVVRVAYIFALRSKSFLASVTRS